MKLKNITERYLCIKIDTSKDFLEIKELLNSADYRWIGNPVYPISYINLDTNKLLITIDIITGIGYTKEGFYDKYVETELDIIRKWLYENT